MSENIKRILVVDDDVEFLNDMKTYLSTREDFKYAGGVRRTSEAIELARDKLPHVILVDVILRDGDDGTDFIEALEEISSELKLKPLIFVTSKNGFYENFSVKKGLPFIAKSPNTTPEVIMKRIARNFTPNFTGGNKSVTEPSVPRDVRNRAADHMNSVLDGLGALKYKGSKYITYIVVYLAERQGEDPKLDTLYELAAKKYGVTKSSVESAVRNAIQSIWSITTHDKDTVKRYYGGFVGKDNGAPPSLSFITHYVNEIKRDYYSEDV